jgi:hypothetical protein
MGIINVTQKGSFDKTKRYLTRVVTSDLTAILNKYGTAGVEALVQATPVNSGLTASSWYYEIVERKGYISIRWRNRNIQNGRPIAILLQYGHGTRNGGYVQGIDYINPVIQPLFQKIADEAWREVTKV